MYRIKLIAILLIAVIGNNRVASQQLSVGFGLGMSHARMSDLKIINRNLIIELPFEAKQVVNFPTAKQFSIEVNRHLKSKFEVGINYNFFSTGSRVSSKDYSGSFRYDNIISNHNLGVTFGYPLLQGKHLILEAFINPGFFFSKLNLSQELEVYGQSTTDQADFGSIGFFLKPGGKLLFAFQRMKIGVYGNLSLYSESRFFFKEDPEHNLRYDGNRVNSDWNGYQYGILFYYDISI
jgi:hypothetical protein